MSLRRVIQLLHCVQQKGDCANAESLLALVCMAGLLKRLQGAGRRLRLPSLVTSKLGSFDRLELKYRYV